MYSLHFQLAARKTMLTPGLDLTCWESARMHWWCWMDVLVDQVVDKADIEMILTEVEAENDVDFEIDSTMVADIDAQPLDSLPMPVQSDPTLWSLSPVMQLESEVSVMDKMELAKVGVIMDDMGMDSDVPLGAKKDDRVVAEKKRVETVSEKDPAQQTATKKVAIREGIDLLLRY
ncbi:hypothetical protein AMTR_s00090p00094920 [Amborella trichopoda]|uniref:Uncharacterized protein n=1 Tax=Amborella trichopoda TaxID=13333 RepID=W1P133_AMBTC|nr:hypothetical protein AMTR_s00090p00094920 [Amborella trichopoda]